MRATKPVLGAITLAVLLGSTACGGGTVTLRPASGSTTPTSDTTISGQTSAGVVAGPDGVTVNDGSGGGVTAGPGGVTVRSGNDGKAPAGDPTLGVGASDAVVFCGQASRYGSANTAMAKALIAKDSGDAEKFAAALATTADAVAQMRRTGPPAIQPDLETLAAAAAEFDTALRRNGGDLERLSADGSLAGISAAAQPAFDRLDAATVGACK